MRILLADDHRLMVEGLANLLAAHGFEVVATAADGFEALAQTRIHRPDVVLMDVRMPRCNGLAATRLIKVEMPETRIVMLTTSADEEDLFEAVRSGASGYLFKSVTGEDLVAALTGLEEEGAPPLSAGLAVRLMQELARGTAAQRSPARVPDGPGPVGDEQPVPGREPPPGLTERQAEVLALVAAGLTYQEVGSQIGLSERTVRYHMAEIMDRLHLEHRSQVIAWAGEAGLQARRE